MRRLLAPLAGLCLGLGLLAGCGGASDTADGSGAAPRSETTVTVTASPRSSPTRTPRAGPTKGPAPAPLDLSRYDLPGFTSPSGNIGCLFDRTGGPHVRCDRLRMTAVPPGKPADCEFDWGHSVELTRGGRGALACTSDSVLGLQGETDGTRTLPYGDSVRYRGIVCTSAPKGVHCRNAAGHSFVISRAAIRVS